MTATYAVSDIHGHPERLTAALHEAGLTDAEGNWSGEDVRLWFLGDFFDRGPDGIGVLELVRRLVEQADAGTGEVRVLLGNHEILALGMRKFGGTFVPHEGITSRSFERSWALNGGQDRDQELLTDDDVAWLLERPMLGLDADHLLMHSDTEEYLAWGDSIDEINAGRPGRPAQRRDHRLVGDLAPDDVAVRLPRRHRTRRRDRTARTPRRPPDRARPQHRRRPARHPARRS